MDFEGKVYVVTGSMMFADGGYHLQKQNSQREIASIYRIVGIRSLLEDE